ncbi:general transcription factor IIF subunit 2 isoform X3 [Eutrema salsugineum]|uniref:general transcription factor IIF subunit 2 isoform X3 n=1 Tax=Eutrema salsugineum TaxID=72664 RepID=UPI000CECE4D9|nr:general transcription factor IIF subunit 2 isoform X3 [Eutrema salsugineum]
MGLQKMQRKILQEEENILAEEIQRLLESATEYDRRKFHELETENADEMVWLMKCPPRVDKAWRDLSASTSSFSSDFVLLAKYMDSVNLLLPDCSPELTMEMVSVELCNISKLYSVNKSNDLVPASIFSEADQGKLAVEGTITQKLDLTPHCDIEQYGKLIHERSRKQVLDNYRGERLMPNPNMVRKERKQHVRRTRGNRSEVEAKMFVLFERQPKWTLKQLLQETNQPKGLLKEILKELCVYTRGRHTYELRLEYKRAG